MDTKTSGVSTAQQSNPLIDPRNALGEVAAAQVTLGTVIGKLQAAVGKSQIGFIKVSMSLAGATVAALVTGAVISVGVSAVSTGATLNSAAGIAKSEAGIASANSELTAAKSNLDNQLNPKAVAGTVTPNPAAALPPGDEMDMNEVRPGANLERGTPASNSPPLSQEEKASLLRQRNDLDTNCQNKITELKLAGEQAQVRGNLFTSMGQGVNQATQGYTESTRVMADAGRTTSDNTYQKMGGVQSGAEGALSSILSTDPYAVNVALTKA